MGVRQVVSQVPSRTHGAVPLHRIGPVPGPAVRSLPDAVLAERIAAEVLAENPLRLRHVRAAAAVALLVSEAVPTDRVDLLLSAAVLHDIGYAEPVRATGFHPLDGAQWLDDRGAPRELVALVAHHSEAAMLPAARPWLDRLDAFGAPDPVVADVLTYADQTAAPDGRRVCPVQRIVDRRRRKPPGDQRAARDDLRRTERIALAIARVHVRLDAAGARDAYLSAVAGTATAVLSDAVQDAEACARVAAVLPALQPADGLEPLDRVRAAVAAARILAMLGPEPLYVDQVVTACRLLVAPPAR